MTTRATNASDRGRRNRANGATCERRVASYLRVWWPDACRAVRNTHPDPGDIDNTSPSLWWSVKDCKAELIGAWFAEMDVKAAGRIGLLVVRRNGYADPARWWCWMRLSDLCDSLGVDGPEFHVQHADRVRMELGVAAALVHASLARTPPVT
jgi:hypothetical protein